MPPHSIERVSYNFEFASDESSCGYYILSGRDNAGLEVFRLSLASEMIEATVLIHARTTLVMSADGTIQIIADELSVDNPIGPSTNVENLIVRAVDHKMLEDEPEAQAMLQILRKRLLLSLATVDDAIESLEKN